MAATRPATNLAEIIARLLARDGQVIELDTIGDEIGELAVSVDDIDRIITALEADGRLVGTPQPVAASADLGRVLQAARSLRASLGRTPTAPEIAAHAELELSSVRSALLFVRVVQR